MTRQVVLVSGFLGAGKTTLALRLIRTGALQNAVLIVNDFGDASFDSIQVSSTGVAYRAMDGGCICCTVKGDLLKTLHEIPDVFPGKGLIWIESSGISDPSDIISIFQSSSFILDSYSLQSVVTVVDGRNCFSWLIAQEPAPQQIAMASIIIINTYDQTVKELKPLLKQIEAFNPLARVILRSIAQDQSLGINDLGWNDGFRMQDLSPAVLENQPNHHRHEYVTRTIRWEGTIRESDLIHLLDHWLETDGANLLRLKGMVWTAEYRDPMVIQGVRQQVTFTYEYFGWLGDNFLVFIGKSIEKDSVDQLVDQIELSIKTCQLELQICQK